MGEVSQLLECAPEETNQVGDPKKEEGQVHTKLKDGRIVFNKPAISNHTKPLYLKIYINSKPLGRVLVDNGSTMNVIPLKTLLAVGKIKDDIIATDQCLPLSLVKLLGH